MSGPCHEICERIKKRKLKRRCAYNLVVPIKYWPRIDRSILPKERWGSERGKYTLFGGGMEKCDRGCYLRTAFRELVEEAALMTPKEFAQVDPLCEIPRFYNPRNQGINWFLVDVPIFVCWLPQEFTVAKLNKNMAKAIKSPWKSNWKEISECREFELLATNKEISDKTRMRLKGIADLAGKN